MAITDKQKQYIEELLLVNSPEQVYQMVLEGALPKFPQGFWSMPENYKYAKCCLQYLIEQVLCWTREEAIHNLNQKVLIQYKLGSPLNRLYSSSAANWLMDTYTDIKPWEFKRIPYSHCTVETIVEATRWLLLEKLQWTKEEIIENWEVRLLKRHGICSGSLVYELGLDSNTLITLAIPEIKLDDLRTVSSKHIGGLNDTLDNVRNLLAQYDRDTIPSIVNYNFIVENGLLRFYYENANRSIYSVLEYLYPGEYKEWEVSIMPSNYWNEQNAKEALDWLINHKLGWTPEQCYYYLTVDVIRNYGLIGIYSYVGHSIENVLQLALPDMYDYSQLKSARTTFHNLRRKRRD